MSSKLTLVLCVVATVAGCVAHIDERVLVHPVQGSKLADGNAGEPGWAIHSETIARPDGVQLYAARFSRAGSRALVLYFGGNGFAVSAHYLQILFAYKNQPVDILMVDHRGYGGSSGVASVENLLSDAVPVYDFARALEGYQGMPIVVHGQSLGSFTAGEICAHRKLSGFVLESSATTSEDWIQGFADHSIFVRRGVVEGGLQGRGNLQHIASLDEPVLFLVGANDQTTRSNMSAQLYAAANVPASWKELLVVEGAGHNDAALGASFDAAFSRLLSAAEATRRNQ